MNKDGTYTVPRAPDGKWLKSGNPLGRLAENLIADVSAAWAEHGAAVLERMIAEQPEKFAALAANLVPKEFQLSVETRLPGGSSADDMEIFAAIKQALPDAGKREPGEVLQHTLDALRAYGAKTIESA